MVTEQDIEKKKKEIIAKFESMFNKDSVELIDRNALYCRVNIKSNLRFTQKELSNMSLLAFEYDQILQFEAQMNSLFPKSEKVK